VFFLLWQQKCVPNEEDELLQKTVNHHECSKSSEPEAYEEKTGGTTHVRVWKNDRQRLMSIKAGMGFKNVAWVVHKLLEEQAKNLASVDAVMAGNVPVVLTGKPLSGKTFFIKQKLLPSLRGNPVLVIDSWDEYGQLRNIAYDVEEAHAFKNIAAFTKFLYGSRHIVRKMVAVTPQTDAFQGLVTLTIYH